MEFKKQMKGGKDKSRDRLYCREQIAGCQRGGGRGKGKQGMGTKEDTYNEKNKMTKLNKR